MEIWSLTHITFAKRYAPKKPNITFMPVYIYHWLLMQHCLFRLMHLIRFNSSKQSCLMRAQRKNSFVGVFSKEEGVNLRFVQGI